MDSSHGSDSSLNVPGPLGTAGMSEQIRLEREGRTQIYYKVCVEGRYYFMKALRPEYATKEYYREMLRKEYELGSQLHSDFVVRYSNLVETPTECYLLMEYVNGMNLSEFLEANPHYFRSEANLKKFLRQTCLALLELHSHQALHLDLKPSNIMLTSTNNDVRLIDLGCSSTDARMLTIGHTDRYAAPEQTNDSGTVDARTDIYALGRVLQTIGENHLPKRYRRIMHRCLQEEKEKRFQSVEEILATLPSTSPSLWVKVAMLATLALIVLYGMRLKTSPKPEELFVLQDSVFMDTNTDDSLYVRVLSVEEQEAGINVGLADVNGDGAIDITDAVAIINLYLNIETKRRHKQRRI